MGGPIGGLPTVERVIGASQSALLVPVVVAESVVGDWRHRYDPASAWGVPAHITVLYPFVEPERIDALVSDRLISVFAQVASFDFALDRVDRFGDEVLFLAPDQPQRFRDMTTMLVREWPDYLPYGGAHPEEVPHLTVARGSVAPSLDVVAGEVTLSLPINARAETVHLMTGTEEPNSWNTEAVFRLG
jgi:2'-5' RNA ligase